MSTALWPIAMQAACRQALQAVISAASPVPQVAWEGEIFRPTSAPYIAETFRPQQQRQRSIGRASGTVEHRADFALTLHYPAGAGTLPVRTMAGAIIEAFKAGTALNRDGCSAWVVQAEQRGAFQTPDRISVPVIIALLGHTQN